MFALSFVECASLDGGGEGGSWSTGTGYKHALKNALCVCPLRLFRLRFSHISLDFFSWRMTWKILSIYSIVLETAALFNSLSLHFSNYTHKHTHAHKMYHPHNEAIPSEFIKIFKTTSGQCDRSRIKCKCRAGTCWEANAILLAANFTRVEWLRAANFTWVRKLRKGNNR